MRRIGLLILALVCLLAACKRSAVAQNLGPTLGEWDTGGHTPSRNGPSDIVTLPNSDFSGSLGFSVAGVPAGGGLAATKFFAIDGWFAQIEFSLPDDGVLVLRVARQTSQALRGTYAENHSAERQDEQIDGIEVTKGLSASGCALVIWERGEFQYCIHASKSVGMPGEDEVNRLVRELSAAEEQA